jgi:S-adenosylmethionine hydrolase
MYFAECKIIVMEIYLTYIEIKNKLLSEMSVEEFNSWKYIDMFGNISSNIQYEEDLKRESLKLERYDLLINLRDA